jgi:hypothetical protein
MKKMMMTVIGACLLLTGCETLRFAPTEQQKQNAWLHHRTTQFAADTARQEDSSDKLRALTGLSQLQSRAFTAYYGLPRELPAADTAEEVLAESNIELAKQALSESNERPDAFELANAAFELAIGLSALLGGVYGTRAVRFFKESNAKSKALQEIITGNELFKSQNTDQAAAFKQAQMLQSPETKKLVTELKA